MLEEITIEVSEPRWRKQRWETPCQVRECELRGLASSYSRFPHALIDASIAHLIADFNRAGMETLYCCSGLVEDHTPAHANLTAQAYILFGRQLPKEFVSLLPLSVYLDEPEALRFVHKSSQEHLRVAWEQLRGALRTYLDKRR